ncbi:hypothetical protein FQA18_14530, partial [Haloferax volcanii]
MHNGEINTIRGNVN